MYLVEQHIIRRTDPRYQAIDQAAFASKNMYNAANYLVRQAFIHQGKYLGYVAVFHQIKHHEAYKALPAKVANEVLRLLDKNWKAFFQTMRAWEADPSRFLGRPALPKYKEKQKGRNILVYDIQALSKKRLKQGLIQPSMLGIEILTKQTNIKQVRIVPRKGYYVVEVVYERAETQVSVHPAVMASIDIGVNTLAAITSNKHGFVPRMVNGRPLKSINQNYNKRRAHLQSQLAKGARFSSHRLDVLTDNRNRRVKHYLHVASRRIIDVLVAEGIGTLVIGKNPLWKQGVEMGKRNNQQFVQIPHARFTEMLCYKAQLVGITVMIREESYTSKASFLDLDDIPTYDPDRKERPRFSGKRERRGLYRASSGRRINADVNGSYNILRKAFPDSFDRQGIGAAAVRPRRLAV